MFGDRSSSLPRPTSTHRIGAEVGGKRHLVIPPALRLRRLQSSAVSRSSAADRRTCGGKPAPDHDEHRYRWHGARLHRLLRDDERDDVTRERPSKCGRSGTGIQERSGQNFLVKGAKRVVVFADRVKDLSPRPIASCGHRGRREAHRSCHRISSNSRRLIGGGIELSPETGRYRATTKAAAAAELEAAILQSLGVSEDGITPNFNGSRDADTPTTGINPAPSHRT